MGYVLAFSSCFGCRRPFGFNPVAVPSMADADGVRRPICAACVERVNPMRIKNGLPPIVPLPDAYDGCEDSELD
jgi:hypothetical protein